MQNNYAEINQKELAATYNMTNDPSMRQVRTITQIKNLQTKNSQSARDLTTTAVNSTIQTDQSSSQRSLFVPFIKERDNLGRLLITESEKIIEKIIGKETPKLAKQNDKKLLGRFKQERKDKFHSFDQSSIELDVGSLLTNSVDYKSNNISSIDDLFQQSSIQHEDLSLLKQQASKQFNPQYQLAQQYSSSFIEENGYQSQITVLPKEKSYIFFPQIDDQFWEKSKDFDQLNLEKLAKFSLFQNSVKLKEVSPIQNIRNLAHLQASEDKKSAPSSSLPQIKHRSISENNLQRKNWYSVKKAPLYEVSNSPPVGHYNIEGSFQIKDRSPNWNIYQQSNKYLKFKQLDQTQQAENENNNNSYKQLHDQGLEAKKYQIKINEKFLQNLYTKEVDYYKSLTKYQLKIVEGAQPQDIKEFSNQMVQLQKRAQRLKKEIDALPDQISQRLAQSQKQMDEQREQERMRFIY